MFVSFCPKSHSRRNLRSFLDKEVQILSFNFVLCSRLSSLVLFHHFVYSYVYIDIFALNLYIHFVSFRFSLSLSHTQNIDHEMTSKPTTTTKAREDFLAPLDEQAYRKSSTCDMANPRNWSVAKKRSLFAALMSSSLLADGYAPGLLPRYV